MILEIRIFVCEKAELVFWFGSVRHCKDRKKRPQELFVLAVINTDELSVWKCCKNGEKSWREARLICRVERRISESRCHLAGALQKRG